ncbi:unnamed protein product [Chrysoparadoxa australica]
MQIHVYSLDTKEGSRTVKAIQKSIKEGTEVVAIPLLRSELKGIRLKGRSGLDKPDLIILVHYNEGRVLLTGKEGYYNDFMLEAATLTGGNLLVALSNVPTGPDLLARSDVLQSLAYSAGQQGLVSLNIQNRFLTWEKKPSEVQLNHIEATLQGGVELLCLPDSITAFALSRTRKNGLCTVL